MSDLQELQWALDYNTKALKQDLSLTAYIDLLIQRNNILTMILQVTQELNQVKKVA